MAASRPAPVAPRARAGTPCTPASTPMLSPDEEARLVEAARGPDRRAADRAMARLMAAHEPLFRRAALRLAKGGLTMDDALQEVRMAALRALPRYDAAKGVRLGRFLVPYVGPGALHDRVLKVRDAPIRTSTGSRLKTAMILWGKARARYVALNGCEPETAEERAEVARLAGLTMAQVEAAERARATAVSFDRSGAEGEGLGETLSDGTTEEGVAGQMDQGMVRRLVLDIAATRGPLSRIVAARRLLLDPPASEPDVAAEAGASVKAVRAEERMLIEVLRRRLRPEAAPVVALVVPPVVAPPAPAPAAVAPPVLDLAAAFQAGLPGIGEDVAPAGCAARARLRRAPGPRRLRPRPQDPRQAALFEAFAVAPSGGAGVALAA